MGQILLQFIYFFIIAFILGNIFGIFVGMYAGKDVLFLPLIGYVSRAVFKASDYKGFSKKLNLFLLTIFFTATLLVLLIISKPSQAQWIFSIAIIFLSTYYFYTHPYRSKN
jgi:hypothetical protein